MKLKIISDITPDVLGEISDALDCLETSDNEVDIDITSYGGDIYIGAAICQKIKEYQSNGTVFNAYIYGLAASAAADIALTCDHISIAETAAMMIHSAYRMDGKKDRGIELANAFQLSAIQRRKPDYTEKDLKTDRWFSADEALNEGLVDEIFNVIPTESKETARLCAMYMAGKNHLTIQLEGIMDPEKKEEIIEKDEEIIEKDEEKKDDEKEVSVEDLLDRISERLKFIEDRLDIIEKGAKGACGDNDRNNARLKAIYEKIGAVCAPAQRQEIVATSTPEQDLEKSKAQNPNLYDIAMRGI